MYLDFFGLRQQPFGVTPDPTFLYLSQTHREALEALHSDLLEDRGFMALVGEPGLGKTTLLYKLLDEWRETSRSVFLFQTQCDSRDFLRYLLAELGVETDSMGLVAMHHKLNHILFQEMLAGRRFILIVDEAQDLDDSVLETARLLSNFETQHAKLLNIVLAGQLQLADKLATPSLRQLRQRIGLVNCLRPLTTPETAGYIKHRLGVSGYSGEGIFTPGALQAITKASQGAPRNINHICHQALRVAAMKGVRAINLEMAQNVIMRLDGTVAELPPAATSIAVNPTAPPTALISDPSPIPPPASASAIRTPIMFSYGSQKKPNWRRGTVAAIVAGVLLVAGGAAYVTPSVRRFAKREYRDRVSSSFGRSIDSGAVPDAEASSTSDSNGSARNPSSQDDQATQVIFVTARNGQTIEELSRRYTGQFDQELYRQISALNPDLTEPDHLVEGQLILLPVHPGALKKMADPPDPPKTAQSDKWQMLVAQVKGFFTD